MNCAAWNKPSPKLATSLGHVGLIHVVLIDQSTDCAQCEYFKLNEPSSYWAA